MGILKEIFNSFSNQKVLIIGDSMVDAYRWGTIERMSPEAPVPVVSVHKRENRLGGAANVALNIQALGGTPILCSILGTDQHAETFKEIMNVQGLSSSGLIESTSRYTTVKTRVISDNKHVLRLDEEQVHELTLNEEKLVLDRIHQLFNSHSFDVVIFEDYNKGLLNSTIISESIKLASSLGIPTLVDPKKDHFFDYKNVSLFKPNLKELSEGIGENIDPAKPDQLIKASKTLRQQLQAESILLTLSEHGVLMIDEYTNIQVPAFKRNIVDVSGAGDTVVAVAAMTMAHCKDMEYIATIANLAGGLVCEEAGVVPINKEVLFSEASKYLD